MAPPADPWPATPEPAPGLATHNLLRTLVERTPPRLAYDSRARSQRSGPGGPGESGEPGGAEALAAWQAELRAALWEVLGVTPEPAPEVEARITESVACDGYTRHRLLFQGAFGGTVPAFLLIPDAARAAHGGAPGVPGVLCLHGHGAGNAGKALVAGAPSDAEAAAYVESHGYDYAVRFARRGYVALAPDALGFGERAPDTSPRYHAAMGLVAEYLGLSLSGLRLLDDQRALTVLAQRPEVDPARLGATGLSEGGKRTLLLAALDERVRAAAVSGYFTSLRLEARTWERFGGWDLCNHLFGLLRVCDLPDVAALAAPRPLLIQNGLRDGLFGATEVKAGFETVRRAYAEVGAPDRCALDLFDGTHVYQPGAVESWFARFLG